MTEINLDIEDIIRNTRSNNYNSIHAWLRDNYGWANKCENNKCLKKSKKFHWAKISDKNYEHKRENFIMLCASCHYWYDEKYKTRKKSGRKSKNTKEL